MFSIFPHHDTAGLNNVLNAFGQYYQAYGSNTFSSQGMLQFAEHYFSVRLGPSVGMTGQKAAQAQARGMLGSMVSANYMVYSPANKALPLIASAIEANEFPEDLHGSISLLGILVGLLAAEGISVRRISLDRLAAIKRKRGIGIPDAIFGF